MPWCSATWLCNKPCDHYNDWWPEPHRNLERFGAKWLTVGKGIGRWLKQRGAGGKGVCSPRTGPDHKTRWRRQLHSIASILPTVTLTNTFSSKPGTCCTITHKDPCTIEKSEWCPRLRGYRDHPQRPMYYGEVWMMPWRWGDTQVAICVHFWQFPVHHPSRWDQKYEMWVATQNDQEPSWQPVNK